MPMPTPLHQSPGNFCFSSFFFIFLAFLSSGSPPRSTEINHCPSVFLERNHPKNGDTSVAIIFYSPFQFHMLHMFYKHSEAMFHSSFGCCPNGPKSKHRSFTKLLSSESCTSRFIRCMVSSSSCERSEAVKVLKQ